MNAWSNLPNAAHIDAILTDASARPEVWDVTWRGVHAEICADVQGLARDVATWHGSRDVARNRGWVAARAAVRYAAWDTKWLIATGLSVRDAIRALIAWDESAALLDLTPDALRTIIDVADGDVKHQAVLLLPAVIARSTP